MKRESLQVRTFEFEIGERTVDGEIPVTLSSDAVVDMPDGPEILVHTQEAVDLSRSPIPIIAGHKKGQVNVGVIDGLRAVNGKLQGMAKFGARSEAKEYEQDVRNRIIRSVSAGYKRVRAHVRNDGVLITTRWIPYHAALVAEPGDLNAGFYRGLNPNAATEFIVAEMEKESVVPTAATAASTKESLMTTETRAAATQTADTAAATAVAAVTQETKQPSALELEKGRRKAIENLAKANRIGDQTRDAWIEQGYSMEQVSDDILRVLEERGRSNPQPASKLGLTTKETQRFSLSRAVLACASSNWQNAGFEAECSRAIAQKLNQVATPNKFYIPFEVMERPVEGKRDLTVATAGAGGYLVTTDNVGFIEMLRNRSVAFRMGARRLSGLQGSVTIPRQSAAATAVWLANEASTITESQQTFVQVALTPKSVGAYTEISRQLLLQSSPGAEGIVTDDLAQVTAIAVDLAALEGTGSGGQPTGISATSGIGSVTGTSLAAAGIIEFMSDVAASNVMPARPGYVTTPAVAGLLMVRPELPTTGTTRLWQGNLWDGSLFGIPAMASNQPTAATMIFGDWQELVIAEWGVLEVEVNPFANFQAGIIGVRAIYSMDVGVRRPFAFSRATTIT